MTLLFHHVNAEVPQYMLGIYTYLLVREQFPQVTLYVIVRDIPRVMMFLKTPKWTLQVMVSRYKSLSQQMKFKLPSDTKELLRECLETHQDHENLLYPGG